MATNKTYTVAGVSTHKGVTKVRFANDYVTRIKILQKHQHSDVQLIELDTELTKEAICKLLMDHSQFQNEAAQGAIAEYVTRNIKSATAPKAATATTEVSVSEMESAPF